MKELWLRKGEDRRLIAGHLWIFANEVDVEKSPLGDFTPGEEALVRNARGQALGSAFVNPHSLICARIHSREAGLPLDGALLRQRLATALSLREGRFDSPYYRVCHGEGDMLPGLVIDRFDGHVAVQIGTAGMEVRKDMIREALHSLFSPSSILWDNDLPSRGLEGLARENELEGHAPRELDVPENGCRFFAPCRTGQKTGWFYDQRRNRAEAARYANGAHVLDIFSYAGGFGGTAARAGAASVTFIDASQTAVDYAARNAARNAPRLADADAIHTLRGDAFARMEQLHDEGRRFGLICLDPPAFIKRRKDLEQGKAAYAKANTLAVRLLEPGGVFVSCSCSHHLPADTLRALVARAAARNRRQGRILHAGGQPEDHPVHCAMPETAYLKCLITHME
mgnify:FL=1